MTLSFRPTRLLSRLCAIGAALTIAAVAACTPPPAPAPPPPPPQAQKERPHTLARHPLTGDQPGFVRLSNMSRDRVPVRVGLLLPFSNGSAATRNLAKSMMNAAQLALFDSRNPDIVLLPGDEGSTPSEAAATARNLLSEGAEIIVGPLFAPSVSAVAPIARDRGVPVVSFSSDRAVAGDGVYLLSYQPETEVRRVISYAAAQGHKNFSALIPRTAYGDHVAAAFKSTGKALNITVRAVLRFDPGAPNLAQSAQAAAASGADAILIAQGGPQLPVLATDLGPTRPQLLGTGLWTDRAIGHEPALIGGWFAAPPPRADASFQDRYRASFSAPPPQLAPLAYDALSLVAALSSGQPYHRFTERTLTDPDGFSGVTGAFRFNPDGTCDRGLAILSVEPDGLRVVDPAPKTFQVQGS
jgi:ABC-type branched-subunit amino acid transport system substrate-binding protein